jgi:hypothetical protein
MAGEEDTFDISTVIDGEGNFVEGWQQNAPAEFKEALGDSKYYDTQKNVFSALKSGLEASRKVGEKAPDLPTNESSDEEWQAHLAKLGAPGKDETYGLEFKDLPESQQAIVEQKEDLQELTSMLQQAGTPSRVAAKIVQSWLSKVAARNEESDAALAKREAALKESWGEKATENQGIVDGAVKSFLSDSQREFLTESGMVDHPVVKSIMLEVGNRIKTGRVLPGLPTPGGKGDGGSLAEALGVKPD